MPNTIPVTIRCCATCRWWDGARTVYIGGNRLPHHVITNQTSATCLASQSKVSRTTLASCMFYARWEKL